VQDASPVRSRPALDNIVLIVTLTCIAIAIVRFLIVVALFPYAAFVGERAVAGPDGSSDDRTVAERVSESPVWLSWWSDRAIPYREGGDYLGVMSHHKTSRNIGCVLGVLAEQDRQRGVVMKRIYTPMDMDALYGEPSGNLMTRADGTTFRTGWALPSRDAALLSNVHVIERSYLPVLTEEQYTQIAATGGLVQR
jgi:hypothetical protein